MPRGREPRRDHQAAAGMAVSHVGRQVLANPEHHPPSAQRGEQREADRQRMRAEQPDRVDLSERPPEATQRPPAARATESGLARLS